MTVQELQQSADYILHHEAKKAGYVSRKSDGVVREYSGRFGVGYVVLLPRWDTTRFCTIQYFIKR